MHLGRIVDGLVCSAYGAANFYENKRQIARDEQNSFSNESHDEDRQGIDGGESRVDRAVRFAAQQAPKAYALAVMAKGACDAYRELFGEDWKPYVKDTGHSLTENVRAAQWGPCSRPHAPRPQGAASSCLSAHRRATGRGACPMSHALAPYVPDASAKNLPLRRLEHLARGFAIADALMTFLENTRFESSIEKAAEDARAASATPDEIRAASNGLGQVHTRKRRFPWEPPFFCSVRPRQNGHNRAGAAVKYVASGLRPGGACVRTHGQDSAGSNTDTRIARPVSPATDQNKAAWVSKRTKR
ncbi:hypothetical protein A0123_03423 [Gluconobacter cerinus]|uniref:Uncharacterized protein n=2 Tax=Gluconobacter cerinus TaxID=38307 RepID=A0A1B6VG54_9PROT|nr:hypothetical protein A0123_03423 [Gluconobacter cerinus]